jgi:hypothetical protein
LPLRRERKLYETPLLLRLSRSVCLARQPRVASGLVRRALLNGLARGVYLGPARLAYDHWDSFSSHRADFTAFLRAASLTFFDFTPNV